MIWLKIKLADKISNISACLNDKWKTPHYNFTILKFLFVLFLYGSLLFLKYISATHCVHTIP